MTMGHVAPILTEAFETYMKWEVYHHEGQLRIDGLITGHFTAGQALESQDFLPGGAVKMAWSLDATKIRAYNKAAIE